MSDDIKPLTDDEVAHWRTEAVECISDEMLARIWATLDDALGDGTPFARLNYLLDGLESRFPGVVNPTLSDSPEPKLLQAIDVLKAQLEATQIAHKETADLLHQQGKQWEQKNVALAKTRAQLENLIHDHNAANDRIVILENALRARDEMSYSDWFDEYGDVLSTE